MPTLLLESTNCTHDLSFFSQTDLFLSLFDILMVKKLLLKIAIKINEVGPYLSKPPNVLKTVKIYFIKNVLKFEKVV